MQYKSLVEILRMPIQDEVDLLPSCISILKKQAKLRLPLLKIRTKSIALKAEKQSKQRDNKLLIMFDLLYLFATRKQTILIVCLRHRTSLTCLRTLVVGSDICSIIHIGFSKFYDPYRQDELYKTYTQRLSIRTTSSEFTYYQSGRSRPILLSDFVTFRYSILARRYRKGCRQLVSLYIGRVLGVRRDFRTTIPKLAYSRVII